jgi:hypothetical protein
MVATGLRPLLPFTAALRTTPSLALARTPAASAAPAPSLMLAPLRSTLSAAPLTAALTGPRPSWLPLLPHSMTSQV